MKFGGSRSNVALRCKAVQIKTGTKRSEIFAAVLNEDSCGMYIVSTGKHLTLGTAVP
jgi:hypothetical protein